MRDVALVETPKTQEEERGHGERGPRLPDGWMDTFLEYIRTKGVQWKAAKMAGVHVDTVEAWKARDPAFAQEILAARMEYTDSLKETMHDQFVKGNVVAGIVLLKAYLPAEFIERHAILNVDVHIDVPTDQARQVLGEMLAHVTPSTVERLSAEQLHREAAPSLPSQGSVAPRSGLILDVPGPMVRRDAESPESREGSERLTLENLSPDDSRAGYRISQPISGIQPPALAPKEGAVAASGPLALPPAGDQLRPPIQARKPLNRGRQA